MSIVSKIKDIFSQPTGSNLDVDKSNDVIINDYSSNTSVTEHNLINSTDKSTITYHIINPVDVSKSVYTTDKTFIINVDKSVDSKLEDGNKTGVTLQPGVLIKSVTMVLDSKNKRPVGVSKFKINLINSETNQLIKTLVDENSIINNGVHNNNSYTFNLYEMIPSDIKNTYIHIDYKTNTKLVNSKCSLYITVSN